MSFLDDKTEPLSGYYFQGKYTVSFIRNVYDDYRDGTKISKLVPKILSPEKFEALGGPDHMSGFFIKNGIKVEMHWDSMLDYYWEADTDKKETEKTVFAWAALLQKEYLRLGENIDDIKPLIVSRFPKYTLEFNKYVYDCGSDGMLLCETVRNLLLPEEFCGFPDHENMCGYFIKNGIRVEMHGLKVRLYDDKYMMNFYWQADTDDRLEEMIIFEWADHIKNEYPKVKRSLLLSKEPNGKVWSDDMSEVRKKYKSVSGLTDVEGRYIVFLEEYDRYIYNDKRDGITFNKIVHDLLRPEEDRWDGDDEISGYFIKDNIKVNTHWSSWRKYQWITDADDEEIKKKVLEWALVVHKEYLKSYLNSKGKKYLKCIFTEM